VKRLAAPLLAISIACTGLRPDLETDGYSCPSEARPFTLRLVDSVRLLETDSSLLGNPAITFMVGPDGTMFIPDLALNRVIIFDSGGELRGYLGRSGGGPGEFVTIGTFGLVTDSVIIQSDAGGRRLNFYDSKSRSFVGELRYEGYLSWIAEAPGAYLAGLLGSQGVGIIGPEQIMAARRGQQQAPLEPTAVSLPKEYLRYPGLRSWRDVKVAALEQGLLVIFGGTDYLQLVAPGGTSDTLRIPICYRRGVPKERLDKFYSGGQAVASGGESVPDTISALLGLYRLPSEGYLIWFQDPTFSDGGRVFEGVAFLTLLSPDLRRVCVDTRVEAPGTGRARLAVSGDSVFVLDQVPTNESIGASYTVVRKHLIDSSTCRWIRIAAPG
jgi:hypothetical protein